MLSRRNMKCHRAQPQKPLPAKSTRSTVLLSLTSCQLISNKCPNTTKLKGLGSDKVSSSTASKESLRRNSMAGVCIDSLSSVCSRLIWILLVLVSIPVGPHNQLVFTQSLTRQWSTRVVTTKQGLTRGFLFLPRGHEGVEIFLGIPYASPPLGSLRLMPPVSGAPWTGVKMNEYYPPVCPQVLPWGLSSTYSSFEMSGNQTEDEEALKWMPRGRLIQLKRLFPFLSNQSEDCLYLNVLVPLSVADGREDKLLPVLVFIHGEDFGYGSGNPYDPSMLVSQGNIVAVTLNYRLGILGFLNANSDGYFKSPANFALLDQIAALHWIQENIGAFGGDRGNVTLMGQGKGAAFVNFLMISNALPTELLFQRVILMSGSALSPLSVGLSNGKDLAKKFAERVKCPIEPPSNMLQCLRQRPLQYFLQSELWRFFGPSDDGVVIEHGIRENILRDKLSHYPLLFGVTRAEILPALGEHDAVYGLETEKRREVLKQLVDGYYSLHRGEILAAAIHEYTDWERPVQHPISVRDETLDALADAQIVSPLVKVGELHSQGNSQTYFYVFEYQSKISDYTQRLGGVPGEDLIYVFGVPLYISWNDFALQQQLPSSSSGHGGEHNWNNKPSTSVGVSSSGASVGDAEHINLGFYVGNFTKNEVQLSLALVHYWANFIRTGNPNAESPEGSPHGFGASGSKGGSSEAGTTAGNGASSGGGTGSSQSNTNAGGNRYSQLPQPASAQQQHQQHTSQDKFTKPKLIEWPPYDTLFKKYLSVDAKPRVRNHYRAHKLSFWLHLVPELMRNGYYNNGIPLGSTGFPSRSNNNNHNSPFNNGNYTTPHSPTIELVGPWEQKPYYYGESNSSYPGDISGPLLYPPGRNPYYHEHHHDGEQGYQIYSTALTVTIAVGCSLLILNILVFAAFYYYRDKRRNRRNSRGRGRHEGGSNYGHQQTPLTSLSNAGGQVGENPIPLTGGGPEGSLSPMDMQMHEMQGGQMTSMQGTGPMMGQTQMLPQPNFVESSTLPSGGPRPQLSLSNQAGSASLNNTPIRFPSHHQQQQIKENGQILNLRHHLHQQQQQQQQQNQFQMPLLPNLCGDLANVPNLQQLLHSAAQQDAANRLAHTLPTPQQQQQLASQHQQFLQLHHQQQLHNQQQQNLTGSGQLPKKHLKGTSNVNLTNLDFNAMPDAILAAAMMLNYRQQPQQPPTSSAGIMGTDQLIPGTLIRSQKSGSGSMPRKSALNMKEQLLISAGIVGSSSSASSANVAGSLGRTGGVGISSSLSPIASASSKQPGTSSISVAPSAAGVANVIQFDMDSNSGTGASAGGGSGSVGNAKSVPRPPKRHTPTVKFSPDTFANNSSSGGNGSPELQIQTASSCTAIAPGPATPTMFPGASGNSTLSSETVSPSSTNISPTANTNVTTINQSSAPGGQTLKSSLKKNSSYSNPSSGMSDELKV